MGNWKYRLKADFVYESEVEPLLFGGRQTSELHFADDWGKYWLSINALGVITIRSNYAWDGCSPKIKLLGRLFGTPDGAPNPRTGYPDTYWASCVHDALCQFADHPQMPYTQAQMDLIFYRRMQADGFARADLYYAAVRKLGGAYRALSKLFG